MSEIEILFDKLWPIYRSITGEGNRITLKLLSQVSHIEISEIKSGTSILDWIVPDEYNVESAFIEENGRKIIDFEINNLHLVSYSEAVDLKCTFSELENHLHYIIEQPDLIPYVTSYYKRYWGFCLSYEQFLKLDRTASFRAVINSTKNASGSMTLGQRYLPGQVDEEVLISTYICHPSMANNELSGPLLAIYLQRLIEQRKDRYYSYRFVYVPETVGAIAILDQYGEHLKNKVIAGLVVTCVGDSGKPTYKKSRRGSTVIDRLVEYKLSKEFKEFNIEPFFPTGSDERQYCSPYYNLPVGSLMRTRYTKYVEYHTSGDNKSIIDFKSMSSFIDFYDRLMNDLELIRKYKTVDGRGEPFLMKYNLYQSIGAQKDIPKLTNTVLWVLNSSDGKKDTLDIAIESNINLGDIFEVCELLCEKGLLNRHNDG
jgi:aminopeptidase-like protein